MSKRDYKSQAKVWEALRVQVEAPLESPVSLIEATTPVHDPITHTCREGDSYASLAASFLPTGMKKHDYAKQLATTNGNKVIRPGVVIKLK
jgi:hypothetical protein